MQSKLKPHKLPARAGKLPLKIEIWNAVTHGIGVVLGIVFLVIFLLQQIAAGSVTGIVAASIYGGCFIFLFLASTIYHAIPQERVKRVLRIFDHIAIFWFIAGSYMPPVLLRMRGISRILLLVSVWVLAVGGTVFKSVTFGKYDRFKLVSVGLYIGMGWMGIFLFRSLWMAGKWQLLLFLLLGGVLYTAGTYFYKSGRKIYNHVIWHLFVLAAAVAHFVGYYFFL